jgi:hypothetical protein
LLILAAALLAGCSGAEPLSKGFAVVTQASEAEHDPARKTLASKVLTAIALERVKWKLGLPAPETTAAAPASGHTAR